MKLWLRPTGRGGEVATAGGHSGTEPSLLAFLPGLGSQWTEDSCLTPPPRAAAEGPVGTERGNGANEAALRTSPPSESPAGGRAPTSPAGPRPARDPSHAHLRQRGQRRAALCLPPRQGHLAQQSSPRPQLRCPLLCQLLSYLLQGSPGSCWPGALGTMCSVTHPTLAQIGALRMKKRGSPPTRHLLRSATRLQTGSAGEALPPVPSEARTLSRPTVPEERAAQGLV